MRSSSASFMSPEHMDTIYHTKQLIHLTATQKAHQIWPLHHLPKIQHKKSSGPDSPTQGKYSLLKMLRLSLHLECSGTPWLFTSPVRPERCRADGERQDVKEWQTNYETSTTNERNRAKCVRRELNPGPSLGKRRS